MAKKEGTPPAAKVAKTASLKVRFNVSHVSNYPGGQVVRLNAIDDLDGVNKAWTKGSPVGLVELHIDTDEAQGIFPSGKTFEVVFSEVLPVITPLT
ncbi:hypothetical protein ACFPMF_01840 [Larkinella bovis]|uniref:Uncharacterized protein n=1 Tax=Larkinella bovis TaxID=683041 RepID=A0ABW0I673_9BACT